MYIDKKAFKVAMAKAGINTYTELSKVSGVSPVTIYYMINRNHNPNFDTIKKIANALNLSDEETTSILFKKKLTKTQD